MPDDTTTTTAPTPDVSANTTDIVVPPPTRWDAEIWDPESPGRYKKKWQETLPENFEPYKGFLSTFDSFEGMVKSHKDMMTQARSKGNIKPLTPESTPEEVAEFRRGMGIPDEPYQFEKPEALPEGVEWKDDRVKAFGEWAQKQNLTPAQAKEALNLHMQFVADDMKAINEGQTAAYEQMREAEKEELRTQFGGSLDGVVTRAKQVALKYGLPTEVMEPNDKRFAGVTMLKLCSDMAKALGESQIPSAASVVNTDALRQAKAMRVKGHPDYEAITRGDKAALDRYYGLLKIAKEQGLLDSQ